MLDVCTNLVCMDYEENYDGSSYDDVSEGEKIENESKLPEEMVMEFCEPEM